MVRVARLSEWNVRLTLGDGLEKGGKDKGEVVTRLEAVPEGARDKSRHARAEAGLLAPWRDAQVHVVAQPVVGVDVPAAQVGACVLREFNL